MGEAAAQELLAAVRDWLATLSTAPVADFRGGIASTMPPRRLPSRPLPCLIHLPRAAGIALGGAGAIAGLLALHAAALHWGQTYTAADFGEKFIENYGWLELFGTRGHFENASMAGGFLVLGPGIVYPDHHHLAEEIYIPLTSGTEWRMGDESFAARKAGEVIHHCSNISHSMRTCEEPLLAFYLWRGGPLAQRSVVTGSVPEGLR